MCRIRTSNYKNCRTENGISISGDRGKLVNFEGNCLPSLAPKMSFWRVWHDNIGKISEEENTRYYVEQYYKEVLSKLDPEEMLEKIPDGSILLCYEEPTEFCHRHLVAFWFELFLGVTSSEVYENPVRETTRKLERPEYLKDILEEVIKENYDMGEYSSIKEAYHHNKHKKEYQPVLKNIDLN